MDAALKLAERVIAYKNVRFIIEHQNDTLDQLSAYLAKCMDELGHAPAKCEVIGGDYIEYRFDSWVNALRSFWNGKPEPRKIRRPLRSGRSCRTS